MHRKASKGNNAGWKNQHQKLVGTEEGGVGCLDTKRRRRPGRAGVQMNGEHLMRELVYRTILPLSVGRRQVRKIAGNKTVTYREPIHV